MRLSRFLFLAAALCIGAFARSTAAQPNVMIILADDLGYSDVHCFGGEVHTANLDALASDGARFTNFYNNARCCPTRASLLTGLYPHQTGVGAMTQATSSPGYAGHLKPTAPTIAEVLQANGYHTAMFGKWHVSNTLERSEHMKDLNRQTFPEVFSPIEQYPTRRGFETYYGTLWGVVNYFNPFSPEQYVHLQPFKSMNFRLNRIELAGMKLTITVESGWTHVQVAGKETTLPPATRPKDQRASCGLLALASSPRAPGGELLKDA
jgi:arylsulfatase A-like enzyme